MGFTRSSQSFYVTFDYIKYFILKHFFDYIEFYYYYFYQYCYFLFLPNYSKYLLSFIRLNESKLCNLILLLMILYTNKHYPNF